MRLDMRNPKDVVMALHARAYLDDVLMPACVMADEEAGVMDVYSTNAEHKILAGADGAPQIVRKFGNVRIELGA
jgi:hypothetical protein